MGVNHSAESGRNNKDIFSIFFNMMVYCVFTLESPTAVTDAASELLRKERHRKMPWVTKDVPDLCDERRDLKKKRYEAEGAKEYREANRRIQKAVKKAKEDWIGAQCEEIETCLNKKQQQESISASEGFNFRETG